MTQKAWSDNQYRGVSLAKTFKRVEKRLKRYDKTDNPDDDERVTKLAYCMKDVAISLNNLSQNEEIKELREELEQVKAILAMKRVEIQR